MLQTGPQYGGGAFLGVEDRSSIQEEASLGVADRSSTEGAAPLVVAD